MFLADLCSSDPLSKWTTNAVEGTLGPPMSNLVSAVLSGPLANRTIVKRRCMKLRLPVLERVVDDRSVVKWARRDWP